MRDYRGPLSSEPPPTPHHGTPNYIPDNGIYTDGSDIKVSRRLGAAVLNVPSRTTIYIDDGGRDETRAIMRGEQVAIHTALTTFATHALIKIFTYSLLSLQPIRHTYTNADIGGP
jgi:hypothetical protein